MVIHHPGADLAALSGAGTLVAAGHPASLYPHVAGIDCDAAERQVAVPPISIRHRCVVQDLHE
jgi:hypothetical protein